MAVDELEAGPVRGPGFIGSIRGALGMLGDRIEPMKQLHAAYGDTACFWIGPRQIFCSSNPDFIQDCLVAKHKDFQKARAYFALRLVMGNGLVTSEGDFHLRQRRMIQPAFLRERIQRYGEHMAHYAGETGDAWQDGQEVDINREMMALALNIVGKALFNSDVAAEAGKVGKALDTLLGMDAVFLNPAGPMIAKLPLPINRVRKAATAELDEIIYRMIAEHRAAGDQGDLLSMLIQARDEDDGSGMTDKQVRDEAVTLFLAGHETTANALTWTWYLLSQHPDVEARMHAEIDDVLAGRLPGAEDYSALDYTRRVLQESMRLFPPVWAIGREALRDTQLNGHPIKKGSQVMLSIYVMQREAKHFPDPEAFDPDRWLPERAEGRHKFAYCPFGGGRRLCIGEGFAWMEGVLVLAALGRHWQPRLKPGHEIALDPHITLRPKGGMPMILQRRPEKS